MKNLNSNQTRKYITEMNQDQLSEKVLAAKNAHCIILNQINFFYQNKIPCLTSFQKMQHRFIFPNFNQKSNPKPARMLYLTSKEECEKKETLHLYHLKPFR